MGIRLNDKRSRERLRDASLDGLVKMLAERVSGLQGDVERTGADMSFGPQFAFSSRLEYRAWLMRNARLRLQAILEEIKHRETCQACLEDKPCEVGP